MHITTEDVVAIAVVLNLVASLFARFHAKKASTTIQAVAADLKNNAPAIVQTESEVEKIATGLVQDLSK